MKRLKVRFVDPDTRNTIELTEDTIIGIDVNFNGELIAYIIPNEYFDEPELYPASEEYKELEIQIVG